MSTRKYRVEDASLREVNTSKKYYTGSRWQMKSGEWITVEGQCDISADGYRHYLVKFDTEYTCIANGASINNKCVSNPYYCTYCNVGYLGEGPYSSKTHKREIILWGSMITRCYTTAYQKRYPTYKGCSVSTRWRCFNYFCADIKYLEGYNNWKMGTSKQYHLDKDIKIEGNKVYSKDTCIFVKASINTGKAKLTGKTYIATSLIDGHMEEFKDMKAWGLQYGIPKSQVNNCARGSQHTVHGWKIRVKEGSNG